MTHGRRGCADAAAPCHLARRGRLNVTSAMELSNAALRRSQDAIEGLVRVSGLVELGRILESLRGCNLPRRDRTLDLVAHATADGLMVLGRSLLAPGEPELERFICDHRDALRAHGFKRLRLLGCYTGCGDRARRALTTLGERLDVAVYGVSDFVDETLFDVDGLSRKWDSLLVRC